jgi:hypothetical protein
MKTKFRIALAWAAVLVGGSCLADEVALVAREEISSSPSSREESTSVATNSRGEPAPAQAPAPKAVVPAPSNSRAEQGALVRALVTGVSRDTSHITIVQDTAQRQYRFTKATHFVDEQGGVLTPDAVKSGTTATLHFARTDGDLVLTKVVVNASPKPMVTSHVHPVFESPGSE